MRVHVLNNQQARSFLDGMSGATEVSDLQAALANADIRIWRHTRTLTDPRCVLYGDTFWMVTAGEAVEQAEADRAAAIERLDALGAPHRTRKEEDNMRQLGMLPPLDILADARRFDAAMRGKAVQS